MGGKVAGHANIIRRPRPFSQAGKPFSTVLQDRDDNKYYEINVDSTGGRIKLVEVSALDIFDHQLPFYPAYGGPYIWINNGLSIRLLIRGGRLGYETSAVNGSSHPVLTNDRAQASMTKVVTPTGFTFGDVLAYIIGATSMVEILMARSTDVQNQIPVAIHYMPEASQTIFDGMPARSNMNIVSVTVIATGGAPSGDDLTGLLVIGGSDTVSEFQLSDGASYETTTFATPQQVTAGQSIGARWGDSVPASPGRPGVIILNTELRL